MPQFLVSFHAEADTGVPLAGVAVSANGQSLGASGPNGLVQTMLSGAEGTTFRIVHTCPEGHQTAEGEQVLTLRSFQGLGAEGDMGLSMNLRCPPVNRRVAIVVRATSEAEGVDLSGLAVLVNGDEVTHTNARGVAQHATAAPAGTPFRVQIGTDARPDLRPQNPTETFTLGETDDIFVMSRELEVREEAEAAPRPRRRRSAESASTPAPTPPSITKIERITRID